MFDDLVESTAVRKKTNKGWAVILSGLVQTFILGILILIPLIYTEALPKAMLSTLLIAPPPPPPPPPTHNSPEPSSLILSLLAVSSLGLGWWKGRRPGRAALGMA